MKDLEVVTLWVMWVQSQASLDERGKQKRGRQCNHGGRDCSDVATNHGTPGTTRSWKRQRMEPPEGVWPLPNTWVLAQ